MSQCILVNMYLFLIHEIPTKFSFEKGNTTGATSEARTLYHCGVDIAQTLVFSVVDWGQVFVLRWYHTLQVKFDLLV